MLSTLLMLLGAFAQIPFFGEIPENVPTYVMTFPDGSVAYGALAVDGQWYTQESVTLPPGKTPTIVFDTPWSPREDRPLRQPQYVLETPSLRKKRLADDWKAAGYAPVDTRQGQFYAPAEEIKLASRARAMDTASTQGSEAPTAAAVSAPPESPAPVRGPIERWGTHAAILLIGLTVTAVIFRKMVLDA